jgi:hypothetical protein
MGRHRPQAAMDCNLTTKERNAPLAPNIKLLYETGGHGDTMRTQLKNDWI